MTTWNPADCNGGLVLSGGNLIATRSGGTSDAGVRADAAYPVDETLSKSFTLTYDVSGGSFFFGLVLATFDLAARDNTGAGGCFFSQYNGLHGPAGAQPSGMWSTLAVGDVVTVRQQGQTAYFSKNGGTEYSLDVSAYAAPLYPLWMGYDVNDQATADFTNWTFGGGGGNPPGPAQPSAIYARRRGRR